MWISKNLWTANNLHTRLRAQCINIPITAQKPCIGKKKYQNTDFCTRRLPCVYNHLVTAPPLLRRDIWPARLRSVHNKGKQITRVIRKQIRRAPSCSCRASHPLLSAPAAAASFSSILRLLDCLAYLSSLDLSAVIQFFNIWVLLHLVPWQIFFQYINKIDQA